MATLDQIYGEFERLGEAEVEDRLRHNYYADYQRAYALRWLSDKSLWRATEALAMRENNGAVTAELGRARRRIAVSLAVAVIMLIVAIVFLPRYSRLQGEADGKGRQVAMVAKLG